MTSAFPVEAGGCPSTGFMSWWWVSSVVFVPMAETSRPDDHEWPLPRQITARSPGIDSSSARMSNSWASISSVNAFALLWVVVGDRGDAAVDLEPDLAADRLPPVRVIRGR